MALFAFSSPAGGLAETQTLLIAARAVQGLGGALLFPATLALVNTTFEEGPARNRALGVWSGAGASGLALGSLLGGLLTGVWGWQAIFYVNVPLAAIAIAGSYLLIPADGPRPPLRPAGRCAGHGRGESAGLRAHPGPGDRVDLAVNPQSPSRRWYEARWSRPSAMEQMRCSTALPGR